MITAWGKLPARDRGALLAGAVLVACLLLWSLAWRPLAASRAALRSEAMANAGELAWMRPASARLVAMGGAPVAQAAGGRSLLARTDAGSRAAGLGASLVAIEPQGAHRVRAQFSGADFDVLAGWLQRLAIEDIQVEELSVQRASGPGRVDARVTLLAGGQ